MEKYRVLYKKLFCSLQLTDEMDLEEARKFRDTCLNNGYAAANIIKIIE